MTNQHPITPLPDLTDKWNNLPLSTEEIFVIAARWGADQELEACVDWLIENQNPRWAHVLQAARRLKPPSLKEQALADLDSLIADLNNIGMGFKTTNLRRALEALPND
jgi:hypothetical protein